MFPLCQVNLCLSILNSQKERPHEKLNCGFPNCLVTFYASDEIQHLTSVHGYPHCGVCHTTSKGVKWFFKHIMSCQDPLVQCGLCNERMPKSELREHVVSQHGFPICPYCSILIGDNATNFIRHVAVCTASTCGLCNDLQMPKFELREHVVSQHGFPICPNCSILIGDNATNFIRHVAVCTVSRCGVCNEQIPKSELREHVVSRHGFPSCPNCSILIGDNETNFIQHVATHGKRKRCEITDCKNGAVTKNKCSSHGGGRRCDEAGCGSSALGATNKCCAHGGGRRCPNCIDWIDSHTGTPKYDGYCARCFKRVFPDDPRSAHIYLKVKEIAVRNMINANFTGFNHNRMLSSGGCDCTRRRFIDHWRLIGGTMLAVETDEFAHRYYDADDEELRHDDLFLVFSGKWVWIRFNPDGGSLDLKDKLEVLRVKILETIAFIEADLNEDLVIIEKLFY